MFYHLLVLIRKTNYNTSVEMSSDVFRVKYQFFHKSNFIPEIIYTSQNLKTVND